MTNADEIVLYQPNDTIHLEVRMAEESVWLTQQQIALLFGVKQPAISKHLTNIFNSGELEEDSVYSILEYTAAYGKMYKTKFYNLDVILSVGYRVNSINATMFRKWVNKVLKDYSINQRTAARQPIRTHTRPHTNTLARPFPMCRRHRLPHRGVAEGLGQEQLRRIVNQIVDHSEQH